MLPLRLMLLFALLSPAAAWRRLRRVGIELYADFVKSRFQGVSLTRESVAAPRLDEVFSSAKRRCCSGRRAGWHALPGHRPPRARLSDPAGTAGWSVVPHPSVFAASTLRLSMPPRPTARCGRSKKDRPANTTTPRQPTSGRGAPLSLFIGTDNGHPPGRRAGRALVRNPQSHVTSLASTLGAACW